MENLIKKLNLENMLEEDDKGYHYEFDDYDTFTTMYNKLENTRSITKNSPQSYLNENEGHVELDGEDFTVYLDGDFNIDDYKIIIIEE